jgi:hypothetical protein
LLLKFLFAQISLRILPKDNFIFAAWKQRPQSPYCLPKLPLQK